jgi:stage II sporulation protein D
MRRVLLVGLLVGCAQPRPGPAKTPEPAGREPLVRVELRSLDPWDGIEASGKGGWQDRPAGAFRIERSAPPVTLRPKDGVFTVGGHTYAGELRWDGSRLVNAVPLENYVLGVLRGELPLKRVPAAAAAAQAIAVRSYTLSYVRAGRADFDLDDTTEYQRYVGLRYAPDDAHLREGVRQTKGLYLEQDGRPLRAYYHSTCGGHTTDVPTGLDRAPSAAMTGVPCTFCEGTRYWRWSSSLDDGPILKAAALEGPLEALEVAERGPGGRASRVRVAAGGREKVLPANAFRLSVGPSALRSTYLLQVAREGKGFRIEGGGWGHGVGLCQLGAIGLADRGKSGEEIARYYYAGAVLRRAY